MGVCSCSCITSGETEPSKIEENSYQEPEFAEQVTDIKEKIVDIGFLLETQSVIRGYLTRKSTKREPQLKTPLNLDVNSEYLTEQTSEIYESLPSFKYGEEPKAYEWVPITDCNGNFKYIGQCNEFLEPEGHGILYSETGSLSEGNWHKGLLHGLGRKISSEGDVYTGEFYKGKKQGKGVLEYYSKLSKYEGEFWDDKPHGNGIETELDGGEFVGEYKWGEKHGKGKFTWSDESVYDGNFKHGMIDGYGKYSWADGRMYHGYWKHNKMHGKGCFYWEDGKSYEGSYVEDKKEGYGVFSWPNGKRYEGYWKGGKEHGVGKLVSATGRVKNGIWNLGKLV